MKSFVHAAGSIYLVMDGVRRAKAVQMVGLTHIQAEVVDPAGHSLGEGQIPIDALRSPKPVIRRITRADENRWKRALAGRFCLFHQLSFNPVANREQELKTSTLILELTHDCQRKTPTSPESSATPDHPLEGTGLSIWRHASCGFAERHGIAA